MSYKVFFLELNVFNNEEIHMIHLLRNNSTNSKPNTLGHSKTTKIKRFELKIKLSRFFVSFKRIKFSSEPIVIASF